ncbi:MAG: transporter substrate-binding domain-containing protein [Methylococcales bacterium]|nr:transporter substrate-binding domain-containing protein [Methylococcales bacterium]
MTREKIVFISQVMLSAVFWIASVVFADHAIQLSPSEKSFLALHPEIILGTESGREPYVIVNSDGSISGYDVDILNRINQLTGSNFRLQVGDWLDMQEKAKNRQIDGLSTAAVQREWEEYLLFSDFYLSLNKALLVVKGNPKNIHGKSDMQGKSIVIQRDNPVDEKLAEKYTQSLIFKVDSIYEMIESVITGSADATFGNGATLYMAQNYRCHIYSWPFYWKISRTWLSVFVKIGRKQSVY